MTAADASFLYFEKPNAALHIGSTLVVEGDVSREETVTHLLTRLHRIPRYRQIAAFDAFNVGHPRWEDDDHFDIHRHISEVTLPDGSTMEDLFALIANLFAPMLPRDRPLWKMVIIHGLPGGRTGLTSLVHHCMVDGVSGMELLTAITDFEADAPPETPQPFNPEPRPDQTRRSIDAYIEAVESNFAQQTDQLRRFFDQERQASEQRAMLSAMTTAMPQITRPAPSTPFNRPVGAKRSYAVVPMSFSEIRGVRSAIGGTINDVVLTTLSGGIGSYLRQHGHQTDGVELRAMVPVNVRSESDKSALGNQVSMFIAPLPVGMTNAAERHLAVVNGMNRLKEANQAGGFAVMSRLADQIPPLMQAFAGPLTPNAPSMLNMVCTNVPGPQIPLYFIGRKAEALWPLVPLSMGMGLNVALTSYNGMLFWGICADPDLVPDVAQVAKFVQAAFDELKSTAEAATAQ
jgi:WS/DGAT/MGAT family acyltransferase